MKAISGGTSFFLFVIFLVGYLSLKIERRGRKEKIRTKLVQKLECVQYDE